jgi:hypothetical protein
MGTLWGAKYKCYVPVAQLLLGYDGKAVIVCFIFNNLRIKLLHIEK